MKNIIKLHLPNGKVYICLPSENQSTDDQIVNLKKIFSSSEAININVEPDITDKNILKRKTLLLWREVLKNTYISIEQY